MNHYATDGPTIISVSGGRTSAFMLRQVLDAHGGSLPTDVVAVFCNTGLEHAATYEFLRDISERWGCPIVWLEYERQANAHGFKIVDFESADRTGKPFSDIITARGMLPNPRMRF